MGRKGTNLAAFLVGYDLHKPVQNYADLFDKLKSYATWWHGLDSTWIVKAALTTAQLRDQLMEHIDRDDDLLVVEITGANWGSYGFTTELSAWLKANV